MKHPDRSLPEGAPQQRRPYESPAIEETSQFETLALACAQNEQICGDYYNQDPSRYDNS